MPASHAARLRTRLGYRPWRMFAVAVVTLAAGVLGLLAAYPASAAQTATICKGTPLPGGYVIVGQVFSNNCPGTHQFRAWRIQTPTPTGTQICKQVTDDPNQLPPIPAGYVITGQVLGNDCPGSAQYRAWVIRTPATTGATPICKVVSDDPGIRPPVPGDFVITGQVFSNNCPGTHPYKAWEIRRPAATGVTSICKVVSDAGGLPPFPGTYVIVAEAFGGNCPGDVPNKAWQIRPVERRAMNICTVSPIPAGFVVVAQSWTSACGVGPNNTYQIRPL